MRAYSWPGNVRELINRVRRAIVLAEHRLISAHDLELRPADEGPMTLAQVREAAEKRAIEAALLRRRNRVGEAAEALGVSRITLYRLMNAYGMRAAADDTTHDGTQDRTQDDVGAAPPDSGAVPDASASSADSGNPA
jgi:DNA-binding NtrC family response regulator